MILTVYTVRSGQLWHQDDKPDFKNGTEVVKLSEVHERDKKILQILKEAKRRWAPSTTNSDADLLISELKFELREGP